MVKCEVIPEKYDGSRVELLIGGFSAPRSGKRAGPMKRSKLSEEQVAYALRQAENGTPVSAVCRHLGVREATFYIWK